MKNFDYYSKPQTPYPNKNAYTTVYLYDKGEVLWYGSLYDYTTEIKQKYPNAVVQQTVNEEQLKDHRKAYGEEVHQLQEEFIHDLFKYYGVEDNPKREAAYALAYEYGHSSGLSEITNYFSELVNLIKD